MNISGNRALKVFLCHASGDKPYVRDLYKRLTREGIDVWLDQEKLLPGQDWKIEIPRAVRAADVVVICLSNKSITKEGYIQKEIKFALDVADEKPDGTIFLIPARIEDCPVPEKLSRWQWVDLFEENGYFRLLRALKPDFDNVEPPDEDLELKLDQLYTEGLAAFYTEDWNKACQRFQAILKERPNHRKALEKLEEAELQRDLSKLYKQAVDANHANDWQTAIKALEELLKKNPDYRDAAQIFRKAKQQKQLAGLYNEAKKLHAAQKWQAVVRVFDQILSIDSSHPDPENLLSTAQREVTELKRLAELNDLYSQAVREIDMKRWQEAQKLLEQVHTSQTGFLETELLLRKVEGELQKVEQNNQRTNQINILYKQAHGLVRTKSWRKALDKIEEIRKLNSQFEDKDGLGEKINTALAQEDQQAPKPKINLLKAGLLLLTVLIVIAVSTLVISMYISNNNQTSKKPFDKAVGKWEAFDYNGKMSLAITRDDSGGYSFSFYDEKAGMCSDTSGWSDFTMDTSTNYVSTVAIFNCTYNLGNKTSATFKFTYNETSDRLVDNYGITWYRKE